MIPAGAIADAKNRYELLAFCQSQGIPLKRAGKGYLGLCPLHPDRKPSFSVDPAKQYWCCLGACSSNGKVVGGDVVELARRLWGTGLLETLERLGSPVTMELPKPAPKKNGTALRLVRSARPSSPVLLAQVVSLYHNRFTASAEAKAYAAERGLTNPELLAALPMGFADGALLETVPEGSETEAALKSLGVLAASGRELLSRCLVIPLRDLSGNVVNLYGRAIDRDQHLYLPGPRCGLVNAQGAAVSEEVIFTESVIDALSFLQAGIANVVPLYGKNGWTPDHDALLEKHRIRRVVLALDNDEAGGKASAALAVKLRARGLSVEEVCFP